MPREVIRELGVSPGDVVVDCTAGGGGHLALFANAVGSAGRVIGMDRDDRAFADDAAGGVAARVEHVTLVRRPFSEIKQALGDCHVERADVVFADLGVSSFQLDEGERGFSFRMDAPLDMRMDRSRGETAAELIARVDEEDLANIIYTFGEERLSRRIARNLKRSLPVSTDGLKDAVIRATGPARGRKAPGYLPTTKKPVVADDDEVEQNPRSRSAKLRVASFDPSRPAQRSGNKYPRAERDDDDDADDVDDVGGDDADDGDANGGGR